MEFFTLALDSLLSRIAVDYDLSKDELVDRYMNGVAAPAPVKKPRVPAGVAVAPKVPKEKKAPAKAKAPIEVRATCGGLTGKRTPCKNKCLAGFDMCHLHCVVLPNGEPKPPKVPKVKKAPAKPPRVRAALNEAEEGGPVDQVAADLDLQARLRLIMREEIDPEEEETEGEEEVDDWAENLVAEVQRLAEAEEEEVIAEKAQTRARVAEDLRLAEEEERAKKVQTRGMAAEDEARKAKERETAKAKGKAPARWAEEEDSEEEEEGDGEITEDEFAEEELEY